MCPTQQTVLLLNAHLVHCHIKFLTCYQLLFLFATFILSTLYLKSLNNSHLNNCSDFLKDFVPIRELGEILSSLTPNNSL